MWQSFAGDLDEREEEKSIWPKTRPDIYISLYM